LNILFLGPDKQPQNSIINFLLSDGNMVNKYKDELDAERVEKYKYDFLISFGYRYIIRDKILTRFKENALNLHISYLPWNRGSDPNLWSILQNTPKGVTIHQLESGIDKGKILYQKEILFENNDTLKTSYNKLMDEIVILFIANWKNIKSKKVIPIEQKGSGTYHKSSDKNSYLNLLTNGWDTELKELEGKAINV